MSSGTATVGRASDRSAIAGASTLALIAACAAFLPAPAGAVQIVGPQDPNDPQENSPWQAGTCHDDGPPRCSVETPGKFFQDAAGHPPVGFTQIIVNSEPGLLGPIPIDALRTVRVDIPPGFTVNPQATPWCETPSPGSCPLTSKVGVSIVEAANPNTGASVELPPANVFNMKPGQGEPAKFGFSVAGNDVFLETGVTWEDDYHEHFTIHAHEVKIDAGALEDLGLPTLGLLGPELARIEKNRLVFEGDAGSSETFLTTPPTCFGKATPGSPFEHVYSTWLRADGHNNQDPNFPHGSAFVESKIPQRAGEETSPKNCDDIPFDPSISVDPGTSSTDSPAGTGVTVNLPEIEGGSNQASSHVRSARVSLPPGMGLNPSAADGLEACTDAQFGKGTRNPVACPAGSRIGTVDVDTPPLPDDALTGSVYVGQPRSGDPASGDLYRIFVTAESERFGISARLLGKVSADPVSGQLTTTFDDGPLGKVPIPGLPQVPFEAFRLNFDSGANAPLTSPPTCGPNSIASRMTPWSSAGPPLPDPEESPSTEPPAAPSADFLLSSLPGGGACPKTLAARPFSPGFGAAPDSRKGGAFSPLRTTITRADGNQELKGVDVTLPPGVSAKLAGVKYCPEAALVAAAANSGKAEAASSSCPASSLIGHAKHAAGSGPSPLQIDGKVFLAGPHKGAPFSLVVVTPAIAGPFDLGTVVSRVALFVDPRTAQVRAVADPIPHVFGGALLDLRSIAVNVDRKNFALNPTNCSQFATAGSLLGGGGNPLDPAAFSAAGVSAPFKATACERLDFKPKLFLRLFGAMRRAKNPKLRAVLMPPAGDANIARAATILPPSLILDQGNLSKVCTRVQFAAHDCPRNSIYGHATAFSPLLDDPLKGPVYLRSSDNPLPDLVAALRGQVDVELSSRTDSVRGRIRNTFDVVPDVPVSKFVLVLDGGPKGLLVNSRNQCRRKAKGKVKAQRSSTGEASASKRKRRGKGRRAIVRFKAQNGKKRNLRLRLRTSCRKKGKAKGTKGQKQRG